MQTQKEPPGRNARVYSGRAQTPLAVEDGWQGWG